VILILYSTLKSYFLYLPSVDLLHRRLSFVSSPVLQSHAYSSTSLWHSIFSLFLVLFITIHFRPYSFSFICPLHVCFSLPLMASTYIHANLTFFLPILPSSPAPIATSDESNQHWVMTWTASSRPKKPSNRHGTHAEPGEYVSSSVSLL
jgi:hypothetical protein